MNDRDPTGELDPRFSSDDGKPTLWQAARGELEIAKAYWLSTVRPDGRPHVTTIAAVWLDDAVYFTTGQSERKARNLAANAHVVLTTGCRDFDGLDVVVEGEAVRVTDEAMLRRVAAAYPPKYGDMFVFTVDDGRMHTEGAEDEALAFRVRATKAFGFQKGKTFSQTRWRFWGPSR